MKCTFYKINPYLFILIFVITSCLKKNTDYADQEQSLIANYISSHPGFTLLSSGIYYRADSIGTGESVTEADLIIINYTTRILETNKLFDTSNKDEAIKNSIDKHTYLFTEGPLKIGSSGTMFYNDGLKDGFEMMKEGGKATMVVPGSLALGSFTPLLFEIELIKVIKNPLKFENSQIAEYIKPHFLTLSDSAKFKGIYLIHEQPGIGDTIREKDTVYLSYTMSLLPYFIDSLNIDIHEKIIETSSDTFSIIIGQTTLIPGFLKAVKQMKNKEISTAVVPYYYGYGSNAQFIMQDSVLRVYQLLIPHYSTLIYKLQIDSVRK